MSAQTIDFQAARSKRERELEEARQRGWLEARRYFLLQMDTPKDSDGFWIGVGVGAFLSALIIAVARVL
jgi:hypothetical protein